MKQKQPLDYVKESCFLDVCIAVVLAIFVAIISVLNSCSGGQ